MMWLFEGALSVKFHIVRYTRPYQRLQQFVVQRQTTVITYLYSKQLLLFVVVCYGHYHGAATPGPFTAV